MKTQRKFTRSRAIKAVGFFVATAFLVSGSIPANAANTGCIFTPTLDNVRKAPTDSLGNYVTANSWQWQPGSDSSNASLSSLGTKVSVVSGNLRNITLGVLRSGIPQTQDLRVLTDTNYQTVAANGTLGTPTALTFLATTSATRLNTTIASTSAVAVRLWLGRSATNASTVTITSTLAQLWPTTVTPTLTGNHVPGDGHTGLLFQDEARVESYIYINPPRKALSTSLIEVGAWR
jgi:hypothetical protein